MKHKEKEDIARKFVKPKIALLNKQIRKKKNRTKNRWPHANKCHGSSEVDYTVPTLV